MKTFHPMVVIGIVRTLRRGRGDLGAVRCLWFGAVAVAFFVATDAVADSQQTFAEKRLGERGNHPLRLTPNLAASEWTSSGQTSEVKVANGRVEVRGWIAGAELDARQFAQIRLLPDDGWAIDRFQLSWKCLGLPTDQDGPRIAFADVWAFVGTNDEPAATFGVFETLRNQPVSQNWSASITPAPGEPLTLRFYAWGAEPLDGSSRLVLDDLRLGGTVVTAGGFSVQGWFAPLFGNRWGASEILAFANVGLVAAVGVLSVLIAVWMLALVLQRFSGMASQQNEIIHALGLAESRSPVGRVDFATAMANIADEAGMRLSSALGRLENRIRELVESIRDAFAQLAEQRATKEASARFQMGLSARSPSAATGAAQTDGGSAATSNGAHFEMLLGKGQALMGLGKPEPALVCFEEALRLEPQNTEAILKVGQALEILQRLDEAMRCYDRAVRLDDSLAIAWLHKGRICNRLERHEEALECYERAGRVESHDRPEPASAQRA